MKQFKLIIPCYFENETTVILGETSEISNYDIHDITFYKLPFALSPYFEKGKEEGTRFYINNESFVTPLKINELEILIESELS